MAALTGLTTIKKFTYRGDPTEEWSNTYHFDVPPPSTDANWKILADALIAAEVLCIAPSTSVVRAYGYNTDDAKPVSVWSYDYAAAGSAVPGGITPVPSGSVKMAGDQAGMFWMKSSRRNSRGKYIYLRKYFHDGYLDVTNVDKLHANQLGYYNTFADKLANGTIAVLGHWRSRTHAETALDSNGSQWVTTRTLHRRGKRPLVTT